MMAWPRKTPRISVCPDCDAVISDEGYCKCELPPDHRSIVMLVAVGQHLARQRVPPPVWPATLEDEPCSAS
jgi:hypothetical protein